MKHVSDVVYPFCFSKLIYFYALFLLFSYPYLLLSPSKVKHGLVKIEIENMVKLVFEAWSTTYHFYVRKLQIR